MSQCPTRRRVISGMVKASAVFPILALAGSAAAAGTTPKSDVKYQFTPNGEAHCGACVSFIPGESGGAPGTCKVVAGAIPQNGWCVLFSKKSGG